MKKWSVLIEYIVNAENEEAARNQAFAAANHEAGDWRIQDVRCPHDEQVIEMEEV